MRGAAPRIPKGSGRAVKKHETHPYTVMTVCTGNICPRIPKGSGRAVKKHETHPYTVMTVCTGNICRSPMGEIILLHEFEQRGLGDAVRV